MKFGKLLLIAFLPALILSTVLPNTSAQALSGSDFQAGRIMDDAVFFNSNSINTTQIQDFLGSKVPVCDTNGTQPFNATQTRGQYGAARGFPPPYTCLKDYQEATPTKTAEEGLCSEYTAGTKSAAAIINDVAKACGINPQLLLVELQIQQSLITDDWPWPIQYNFATGFGCPDTAACDPQYQGFFNQVYGTARQFKYYIKNPNLFSFRSGVTNSIQYSPNPACGSSAVFIQNQATAALYNYTPYQPNAASLANLNGIGDACSSYTNRNLWRYFNDWFGSTIVTVPAPTAAVTINGGASATVAYGSNATLSWSSANATSCTLNPGSVSSLNGTQMLVKLTHSVTYQLECTSAAGSASASASVIVTPPTFAYILGYIASLDSTVGSTQTLSQQITQAQNFYTKGDSNQAKKFLTKASDDIDKLVRQSRLSPTAANELKAAINDLTVTL